MTKLWNRLFLEERSILSLSLFRIAVALTIGFYLIPTFLPLEQNYYSTAFKSLNFTFFPQGFVYFVQKSPDGLVLLFVWLFCVSWFFFLTGLYSQISCIVMFLCCYFFYALNAFAMSTLSWDILLVALFLMCISPYHGVYFSVDALRKGDVAAYRAKRPYFVQRLFQFYIGFVYFYTAMYKVTAQGNWLTDKPLYYLMNYPPEGVVKYFMLKEFLAAHPELCYWLGVFIVIIEFLMIFLLFWHRTRISAIYLGFIFHILLILTLDVPAVFFFLFPPMLLLFINSGHFLSWVENKRLESQVLRKHTVVYDGKCRFCLRSVRQLQIMDLLGRCEFKDYHQVDDLKSLHPDLSRKEVQSRLHVIDNRGRLTSGFGAFRRLSLVLPMMYPMLLVFYFPGAGVIGPILYHWVAQNRYIFHFNKTCTGNACFRMFLVLMVSMACVFLAFKNGHAQEHFEQFEAPQGAEETIEKLYEDGVNLYKEGDYEKAKIKFIQVKIRDRFYRATQTFLDRIREHIDFEDEKEIAKIKKMEELRKRREEREKKRLAKVAKRLKRMQEKEKRERVEEDRLALKRQQEEQEELDRQHRALKEKKDRLKELARKREEERQERLEKRKLELLAEQKEKEEAKKKRLQDAQSKEEFARIQEEELREKEAFLARERERKMEEAREEREKNEQLKKERQEQLIARNQQYRQKKMARHAKTFYERIRALYKKKEYEHADYEARNLKKFMKANELPEGYVDSMNAKLDKLQRQMQVIKSKEADRRMREKEKEQARLARQKKKEEQRRQREVELEQKRAEVQAMRKKAEEEKARTRKLAREKKERLLEIKRLEKEYSRFKAKEKREVVEQEPQRRVREVSKSYYEYKKKLNQQRNALRESVKESIDDMYLNALQYYKKGSYLRAKEAFEEVDMMKPNYKLTRFYLEVIDQSRVDGSGLEDFRKKTREKEKSRDMVVTDALDFFENR